MMQNAMCVEAWRDGDLLLVYTNISYLCHLPPPATQHVAPPFGEAMKGLFMGRHRSLSVRRDACRRGPLLPHGPWRTTPAFLSSRAGAAVALLPLGPVTTAIPPWAPSPLSPPAPPPPSLPLSPPPHHRQPR